VSVGSLYQYFPNKQSILFRLQLDEWEKTGATIEALLGDVTQAPAQRTARDGASVLPVRVRRSTAAHRARRGDPELSRRAESRAPGAAAAVGIVGAFVAAAAPQATARQRRFAAEVLFMTMTAVGKQVSERPRSKAEIHRWADAIADMLTTYLAGLAPRPTL